MPDFVAVITIRSFRESTANDAPLQLVIFTIKLPARLQLVDQAADLLSCNVRTRQVELIFVAVERSVSDQEEAERVVRLSSSSAIRVSVSVTCFRVAISRPERDDMHVRTA